MKELILPLICLLVVSACILMPPKKSVSKAVEPQVVTHIIYKKVPGPIQVIPAPQPIQPLPRQHVFPILGAPVRFVGRLVMKVRHRIILTPYRPA